MRHLKEKSLNIQTALFVLACGLPGVFISSISILSIPEFMSIKALRVLTLGLGIYSVFNQSFGLQHQQLKLNTKQRLVGGFVLFLLGILNGSLTSGTGLFVTLWLVRWFGFDYKLAVSYTLILVCVFWNGARAITLSFLGDIYWQWLPPLF